MAFPSVVFALSLLCAICFLSVSFSDIILVSFSTALRLVASVVAVLSEKILRFACPLHSLIRLFVMQLVNCEKCDDWEIGRPNMVGMRGRIR